MSRAWIFAFVLIVCLAQTFVFAEKKDYGVMIDAGSSGTRVYLYSWDHRAAPATNEFGPFSQPITQEDWSFKVKKPLAKFASKTQDLDQLFTPILNYVKDLMNTLKISDRIPDTPIYLGATAGMREIPSDDRDTIMTATRSILTNSGFSFSPSNARILSGEEEALFGWIAANYLSDTLNENTLTASTSRLEAMRLGAPTTVGALDLGGASTQITFEHAGDLLERQVDYTMPSGNRKPLYVASFLEFGLGRAWDRIAEINAAEAAEGATVDFACFNVGYTENWKNAAGVEVVLTGTGNATQCMTEAVALLQKQTTCFYDNCSVNGSYQPPVPTNMDFLAFSGYYSATSLANLPAGRYSLTELEAIRSDILCKVTWEEMQERYPGNSPYLFNQCTNFSYIVALLRDGFGFDADTTHIVFQNTMRDTELAWALGGMVYEANLLNYDRQLPEETHWGYIFTIVILVILAAALGFLLYKSKSTTSAIKFDNLNTNSYMPPSYNDYSDK